MNKTPDVVAFMKEIRARVIFMSSVFTVVATIEKIKRLEDILAAHSDRTV
jgi:hypothetical protein